MPPNFGQGIPSLTENENPADTDYFIMSSLQQNGQYSSVKVTQQNATKKRVAKPTASYTALPGDDVILVDATLGPVTVTLPDAVSLEGVQKIIKKIDSSANHVTISCYGSETIDGVSTQTLTSQYQKLNIISDGANWQTD